MKNLFIYCRSLVTYELVSNYNCCSLNLPDADLIGVQLMGQSGNASRLAITIGEPLQGRLDTSIITNS